MPRASRRAQLSSERADRRAGHDWPRAQPAGTSPSATATPPSAERAGKPGRRAFERHRPGRARRHRAQRRDQTTSAVPTPCRSRWRSCRCRRPSSAATNAEQRRLRGASVSSDSSAAMAATPVLAIALPGAAPAAAFFGDAEQRLALAARAARSIDGGEERHEQQHPALPAGVDEDRDADDARRRSRPGDVTVRARWPGPRDQRRSAPSAAGSRAGCQAAAAGSRS